jgi:hypothetical protein
MFCNKRPLVLLLIMALGISLVAQQQSMGVFSAFASESSEIPYDSGYNHGCDDAGISDPGDRYINQPGKGSSFHTEEFMSGYDAGFNRCSGRGGSELYQPPDEAPSQPDFDQPREIQPQQGGMDWIKTCNDLQMALVSSCEVLVNPDNTLTTEGERAVGCIRNGIALAGGGTLLLSLPLPLVIAALQILEEPTGCGGIVEWGLIGDVGDLRGIINRLT